MTLPWRSALSTSIAKLLLLPKFDNSSPFVTQDKEICHMIISQWRHYHLRRSTQWNPFNVYLLSKFDVSSFSVTGDRDFRLVILLTLRSSKLIFILLILGKSKLSLFALFYYCGQAIVTLLSLGKTCHEKQSKPSLFDKNSRTTYRIWHKLFSMIQSVGIKNWFPQSINRLYRFSHLLL